MVKWRTAVPKFLRNKKQWDEWEAALAFATIFPRLLSPRRKARRSRIRTLHYLVLLERLSGERRKRVRPVREFVTRRLRTRLGDLAHTARIEWYREQMLLDSKAGEYITPILTVGTITKILMSRHGIRGERRTLDAAFDYLGTHYGRGIAITGDRDCAERYWRKWKHAAHLCAAFVDFLPRDRALRVDEETLSQLEKKVASFVVTAMHYQDFLAGVSPEAGGVGIRDGTRRSFKLAVLDSVALTVANFVKDDLPLWDSRRAREL